MLTAVKSYSELIKRIGKIAEDNPGFPYSFIKDILVSLDEIRDGKVEPYQM